MCIVYVIMKLHDYVKTAADSDTLGPYLSTTDMTTIDCSELGRNLHTWIFSAQLQY